MKIKMLKTELGADDGIHISQYVEKETYEVTESLSKCFLSTSSCELVTELVTEKVIEKEEKAPYETKEEKTKIKTK